MTHLADFAARLEQKLKEVEDDNVSLANQRDELLDALETARHWMTLLPRTEESDKARFQIDAAIAKVRR